MMYDSVQYTPGKNPHIPQPYAEIIEEEIIDPPKPVIVPDDDSDSFSFPIKIKKKDPANKKRPWDRLPVQLEETLELLR